MSLGTLLLGVFLILVGITWLTWVTLSVTFLGVLAFVTGIVLLLESSVRPIVVYKRQ